MNGQLERLGALRTSSRRPGEVSWSAFAGLVVLFVVGLSIVSAMSGIGGFLVVAGSFALLGLAGRLWGVDTRDGGDWKERQPGAIR
jgi:hypothetical protein